MRERRREAEAERPRVWVRQPGSAPKSLKGCRERQRARAGEGARAGESQSQRARGRQEAGRVRETAVEGPLQPDG